MTRRIIALGLIVLLCLTGCSRKGEEEETTFTLSAKERKEYEEKIDKTLYDFYWRYDSETLLFLGGSVPNETEENQNIFEAAADCGFFLAGQEGKKAVVATVELLHFNGDKAGLAYFYFVHDTLVGAFYSGGYDNGYYSLKNRNLFLADGKFSKFESDAPRSAFLEKRASFPVDGFDSSGRDSKKYVLTASVENNKVSVYRFQKGLQKFRTLYAGNNNKIVSGVSFLLPEKEGGGSTMAVLLSRLESHGEGEGHIINVVSEKLVFYDENLAKSGKEMTLDSENYTCVAVDGNNLVLADGGTLEYYEKTDGGWTEQKQYFLSHGVTQFHIADLDGDGRKEYLMTDGLDLYLYHKTKTGFTKIWSTHLAVESLTGAIYTGDLNQDGVKEVYVSDITGTTIRYVLTKKGLMSHNEDIAYGERIYALDFDRDGKDDYIGIQDIEKMYQKIYISE